MTRIFLGIVLLALGACHSPRHESSAYNPLGWPARGLTRAGFAGADSGLPLVRELGRLIAAIGELLDAPALLVEGAVTLDGDRFTAAGEHAVVGSGSTFTAAWNVPFFIMPGRTVDLAPFADLVNEALTVMESVPPTTFRVDERDQRTHVFPPGTRVRASGENLIYTVPGYGEIIQSARSNVLWDAWNGALGTDFVQERSWGFVVRDASDWRGRTPSRFTTKLVLHEFYHQFMQMRVWMQSWTAVYWPAYMSTYPFTGWYDHWAEAKGRRGAGAVDRALTPWILGEDPRTGFSLE